MNEKEKKRLFTRSFATGVAEKGSFCAKTRPHTSYARNYVWISCREHRNTRTSTREPIIGKLVGRVRHIHVGPATRDSGIPDILLLPFPSQNPAART